MDERVDFYNKIFSDKPEKWDSPYRDTFACYVLRRHIENPGTFLDIGCGNGHTIEFFKKRWPDTQYYGVDLSDVAIKVAEERVPEAEFICTTFEELELPICDVLVVMGVAEHFRDLDGALRRLKKLGKLIFLEVPDCLSYSDNKEEGYRVTGELVGVNTFQSEWHLKRPTWERYMKAAGLEIVDSYPGLTPETKFVWVLK